MRTQLLDRLRGKGVLVSVVDGKLRVKAPAGVLQPADREAITLARDELIQALESERMSPPVERSPCSESGAPQAQFDCLQQTDEERHLKRLETFYSAGHDEGVPWSEDDLDLVDYLLRNIEEDGFWSVYFHAADRYLHRTLPEPLYQLLRDAYERARCRWTFH